MLILINSGLIFSQTTEEDLQLKDYLTEEKIPELAEADTETKQQLWDNANILEKRTAITEISNHLTQKRWEGNMLTNGALALGRAVYKSIGVDLSSVDVSIGDIDLEVAFNTEGGLSEFAKDFAGVDSIDSDLVNTEIKEFIGFENENLKWSSETIIGDGNVYLDLKKIPVGTEKVEYRNDGKFVLHKYDGSKLVISNTDEKGNIIVKSSQVTNADDENEFLKINPFDIGIVGEGEVEFTEDGFKLTGDAVLNIEGMTFNVNKNLGNEGFIKINSEGFVLNGANLEIEGFGTIIPTKPGDFVFFVGDETLRGLFGNNLPTGSSLDEIQNKIFKNLNKNQYDLSEIPGLIREVSFEDYVSIGRGGFERRFRERKLRFDENGELSEIGIDGKWVSIKGNYQSDSTEIGEIYRKSDFLDRFIRDVNEGKSVKYSDISEGFYSKDSRLKLGEKQIKIDSYHNNFAALLGENLLVGGNGIIDLKKSLNSLTGLNGENFNVRIGDFTVKFNKEGVNIPYQQNFENSYLIDQIFSIKDGKKNSATFQVIKEEDEYLITNGNTFSAGRLVMLGPLGSSAELYTTLFTNDDRSWEYGSILTSKNREELIERMLNADFETGINIFTPKVLDGVTVKPINKDKLTDVVFQYLKDNIFVNPIQDEEFIEKFGLKIISSESIKKIEGITQSLLKDVDSVQSGRMSISIKNNRNKNPSMIFTHSGGREEIKLTGENAQFIKDTLELSLRLPNYQRGKTTSQSFLGYESRYSGAANTRQLWINTFGDRIPLLYLNDVQQGVIGLVTPGKGFFNEYIQLYLEDVN